MARVSTMTAAPLAAVMIAVIGLATAAAPADMLVGRAVRSWGTATVERDGSDIPFTVGMDLEDGDVIKTERNSGAVYELYDRYDVPFAEEEIFGLPGPGGCADADGDRGKGRVKIRARNRGSKRRIISKIKRGTTRTRTLPGGEDADKYHETIANRGLARKKGTELAMSYDEGSDLTSLSVLSGLVAIDNIDYASLPDGYFTDPFDKSADTLDLGVVLLATSETTSVSDLLGAGNSLDVGGGSYATVASAPTGPFGGRAPIHDAPGGLSPEPATMGLLAIGAVALLRRRSRC